MMEKQKTAFAPQLVIPSGTMNIDFYLKGVGAKELRRFSNDDGSIHVSELSFDGCLFHLHEETPRINARDPLYLRGFTITIGLFTDDVDKLMARAEAAGATVVSPAQDYEYGYRQGQFIDPFGHHWLIEKVI